jgi:lipid II:glycine glycyltransferase (peptidoglycan interpeptide bridge formation enzyme)
MQHMMAKASEHPSNLPEAMEANIFNQLRQNCVNYLTSGSQYALNDYNPQDPRIKFALQELDKQVKEL